MTRLATEVRPMLERSRLILQPLAETRRKSLR